METKLISSLTQALIAMADDQLILAQRDAEWTGHAPLLEEDIAFANLALDELGHAQLWYREAARLQGQDLQSYPDQMVYFRSVEEYRCAQIVELPRGDWAFTILRQYLVDSSEMMRLEGLLESVEPELAAVAAKILPEERYHLRHSQAWVERLAQGTEESYRRMEASLVVLWPLATQLLAPMPEEEALIQARVFPSGNALLEKWQAEVGQFLSSLGLTLPVLPQGLLTRQLHTFHLKPLLAELQSVAQLDPDAEW